MADTLAQQYLDSWRPTSGWGDLVRQQAVTLWRDPDDVAAWANLAMMLGDTRAAPLCLFVCLHAHRLPATPALQDRLSGHMALALWDLGLGQPARPDAGPIVPFRDRLEPWLARELAPLAGDVAAAARFSLVLAAVRTGVAEALPGAEMTITGLSELDRWTVV